MAKIGNLVTDLSIDGNFVTIILECGSPEIARKLYEGLRESIKEGRIELTHDGAETIEEVTEH